MKQVVILAGGKGTRLRERLGSLPKPLIDICGVPLLERQILLVKKFGFERVLILVNYQSEQIVQFCEGKGNWGLDIQCIDDGQPRGTAGALLQVLDRLDENFLVMYGDTMLDVDLHRFCNYHDLDRESAATLFLHPNDHPHDSDLVDMDERGYISAFYPYPHDPRKYYPNLVNAALYCMRRRPLEYWRETTEGMLDFGKQLFPTMIEKGMRLRGYNSPEYIKDCGTPTRIDKVCADFESGKIARAALTHPQSAIFIDRDGTINYEVDHLNSPDQFELLPGVEKAIRRLNLSEYRVCVVTNQPVLARGECSTETLREIHNKLETLLGYEGAFLDRIYYCPHHPEKGFEGEVPELKIDCDCRKPKTGMIDSAIRELNVKRAASWMIGDSSSDILTAQRAGLKSVLVESGYAGLDGKYHATPDYTVPDLSAAVSFILDGYPAMVKGVTSIAHGIRPGDLIFVGGQARSGKSSFASVLRDVVRDFGNTCHVLTTDRWLLSERDRGDGVLARHAVDQLDKLVLSLIDTRTRPSELTLPAYSKPNRQHVSKAEMLGLGRDDVIIIEGVVALHFAAKVGAQHRYFIEIHEESRKQRIIREYETRGFSQDEAISIYEERLAEEVPWVLNYAKDAIKIAPLL